MKSEEEEKALNELNISFLQLKRAIKNYGKPAPEDIRKKAIEDAVSGFNPDVDVIVSKSHLELLNELKMLSGIKLKVDAINDYVDMIKTANEKSKTSSKNTPTQEEKSLLRRVKLTQPKRRF